MNRRGFLKMLAAIPGIRHIPLPAKLYGSGSDGDLTLSDNKTLSPYQAMEYIGGAGGVGGDGVGGGGGGGVGGIIIMVGKIEDLKVTANGGSPRES